MSSPTVNDDDLDIISADEYLAPKREKAAQGRTLGQGVARFGERAARTMGETLVGMPKDIFNMFKAASSYGKRSEESLSFLQKPLKKGYERIAAALPEIPGSAELRARDIEESPWIAPESKFEEAQDEVFRDFATLALPVKGKIPFVRAIGSALSGNLAKQTAKYFGLGEKPQEAAKLGTMILSGMVGRPGLNTHVNQLYKEAESLLPEGVTVDYSKSLEKLNNLEKQLKKGAVTSSDKTVLGMIKQIKNKVKDGRLAVDESVAFDRSVNDVMGDPALLKGSKKLLGGVKGANMDAIESYAAQNPTWGDTWKEARQMYQGIHQTDAIKDFVTKNMSLGSLAYTATALGMTGLLSPVRLLSTFGKAGAAGATGYGALVLKRIATNPAMRRYYSNILGASLNQNKGMLVRNANKLEESLEKEFEKNPIETVEFEDED